CWTPAMKRPSRARAARSTARAKSSGSTPARSSLSAAAAAARGPLQGSKPFLQSAKAGEEVADVRAAVARCSGSGRGPCRLLGGGFACGFMRRSRGAPCRSGRARRRGGGRRLRPPAARADQPLAPQARHQLRQVGIGGGRRELVLPQVEKALGERRRIGRIRGWRIRRGGRPRLALTWIGHGQNYIEAFLATPWRQTAAAARRRVLTLGGEK